MYCSTDKPALAMAENHMLSHQPTALVKSTLKSPEEQELDEKRQLLEELETEFASLQLEYSTLSGGAGIFRNRYYLRVEK
jgi:DNA repair ATPase RecN